MPNARLGHQLRESISLPNPSKTIRTQVLIIGGGISGLSARRWLQKAGINDVWLLELESEVGGNAKSGSMQGLQHPLGAHYLPVPQPDQPELLEFLQEAGCIIGHDINGLPEYNPYFLCHDPMERLFLDGRWMEGLVPSFGLSELDQKEFQRFFEQMATLKKALGQDGKALFKFPLRVGSRGPEWLDLEQQSFASWLELHHYRSPLLFEYLRYCCKDDYGADLSQVSAFAGLHYHAARQGKGANASSDDVLVWPEGNAFLVKALMGNASQIVTGHLAYQLQLNKKGVTVQTLSANESYQIEAQSVILAVPASVAHRLLQPIRPQTPALNLQRAPWVITNLLIDNLPEKGRMSLCWDNVLHGSESVGYVIANHQLTDRYKPRRLLSHYWPLVHENLADVRQSLMNLTREAWLEKVENELKPVYPDLRAHTLEANVWIWGHGMVRPSTGLLSSQVFMEATKPVAGRIFFAHTDYSGISVFEEAFDQGIRAAQEVLQRG